MNDWMHGNCVILGKVRPCAVLSKPGTTERVDAKSMLNNLFHAG